MKQLKLLFALAIMASLFACTSNNNTKVETAEKSAPQAGSIVYFQLDSVLRHYDMFNDLSSELEAKAQKIQNELQSKARALQKDAQDFQNKIDKGLLTRAEAEERNQVLTNRSNDISNLQMQRQQEMAEEEAVTLNKVYDAIRTFVTEYNADKNYTLILANTVFVGDPTLDITQEIIEGLNNQYVKNKKSGKTSEAEVEKEETTK